MKGLLIRKMQYNYSISIIFIYLFTCFSSIYILFLECMVQLQMHLFSPVYFIMQSYILVDYGSFVWLCEAFV
jgi:hypothetical protein